MNKSEPIPENKPLATLIEILARVQLDRDRLIEENELLRRTIAELREKAKPKPPTVEELEAFQEEKAERRRLIERASNRAMGTEVVDYSKEPRTVEEQEAIMVDLKEALVGSRPPRTEEEKAKYRKKLKEAIEDIRGTEGNYWQKIDEPLFDFNVKFWHLGLVAVVLVVLIVVLIWNL